MQAGSLRQSQFERAWRLARTDSRLMPLWYVDAMSELPRNRPLQYLQVSLNGKTCGPPARVLWHVRPASPPATDGPRGWCITEPCPEEVRVTFLAMLLHVKPFKVVADLLNLGLLVDANQAVPFDTALELLRLHGYTVEEA